MNNPRAVVVISPHMDDEVLGCGGTIARHIQQGDSVAVCIVCNRAYNHRYSANAIAKERAAARQAQKILGYKRLEFLDLPDEKLSLHFQDLLVKLERILVKVQPEIVYTCHAGDLHQDHRVVAHASNIVLRATASSARRILAYEVPSGTDQAFPNTAEPFLPNVFMDISNHLNLKLKAMAAYKRESRPFPHPRSREMLTYRAHVRGAQCGCSAAEAFALLKETL